MIRLRLSYFAVALLSACSAIEDNRMPDAPVADTTPPTIMLSTPANMAKRVSVIEPVVVQFDEDIDPATVSATSVVLSTEDVEQTYFQFDGQLIKPLGPGMARLLVPATVTYDAIARVARVVPKAPLAYGKHFRLDVTVKDVAGNELVTHVQFVSAINGPLIEHSFDTNAQAQPYVGRTVDANGYPSKHISWTGPGLDLAWFTADDATDVAAQIGYNAEGRLVTDWFTTAGTDALFNTPDDVIDSGFTYSYDAQGHVTELQYHDTGQAGPDTIFGTPDDGIRFLRPSKYMGDRTTGWVFYTTPGVDTMWRTADDECALILDATYDTAGHRTREVMKTCGTDKLPATADDVPNQYWEYTYDANHVVTKTAIRNGPGLNTTWLDSDDDYASIEKYTVDANGLVTQYVEYTDAGIDTVWDSGDEIPSALTKTTYNANKQPSEIVVYAPGMDAKLGTPDDIVRTYTLITYEALGNRVTSKTYDTGPDLMAHDGDDRMLVDRKFDTAH